MGRYRRVVHVVRAACLIAAAAVLVVSGPSSSTPSAQGGGAACTPPLGNPIVCENQLAGEPMSQWDVEGAGDPSIQGFATEMSVDQGSTLSFKVDTDAPAYRIDIYRLGYYGGAGARKVATVVPSVTLPQHQPECLTDDATGLVDCGNWNVSASWLVPTTAVSGIYLGRLVRTDTSGASHIVFIVRDDDGGAEILAQASDPTWQAYNDYGGNSLYTGAPAGRAFKVSYNRPFTTRVNQYARTWLFGDEYPMIRWLEANGYWVSYSSGIETDRRPAELQEHKVFLSFGHDEYWSAAERSDVEAARGAGVNLAFFSANEVFWKTRWENSISASQTPYRTLVSYKETHADSKIDPLPNVWTGTWRDARFSPPADGGRPENALTGTMFVGNCCAALPLSVAAQEGRLRFWRHTPLSTLAPGTDVSIAPGIIGYEFDADVENGSVPRPDAPGDDDDRVEFPAAERRFVVWSRRRHPCADALSSPERRAGVRRGNDAMGVGARRGPRYRQRHPERLTVPDATIRQATVNLFADMGVQPLTPQLGLVLSPQSTDVTPPVAIIAAPAGGSTIPPFSTVVISGTATDAGGRVSAVEVSTDGGTTWRRATGEASWSYVWQSGSPRSIALLARAIDDSGNIETPTPGAPVVVGSGSVACPCSIWPSSLIPGRDTAPDNMAVELGVKFRSDVLGWVTGIRFYKGAQNGGVHTGSLWTSTGSLLATATFTQETGSGWQQVSFSSPVMINAGTTYIASYHTDTGFYAADSGYFALDGFDYGPLHALREGVDGGNGVFRQGSSGFPNRTYQSTNYWVDVLFATSGVGDETPPQIGRTSPALGARGVSSTVTISATFNEALDPATVSAATFDVRDAAGVAIGGTVSYNSGTLSARFEPAAPLASATVYTARLRSGTGGIADSFHNELAQDYVWSFTTGAGAAAWRVFGA